MFKRFYKDVKDELCAEFSVQATSTNIQFSPAQIQGHLLIFKESPEKAIAELNSFGNR